jgi:phage replication-related protein YjqB (UPF0714/DUF867 family)
MRFPEVLARPGVNETMVLRGDVGIMAPHGASVEDGTERVAAEVAERCGASLYAVTYPGTWEEARALHVSCSRIEPDASPALQKFMDHCRVLVAIHGFTREHLRHAALVGGRNTGLAALVGEELRERLPEPAEVLEGDDVPEGLRGRDPANIVNRAPEAGAQIELAPRLRVAYPSRIFWGGSTPNPNVYADAVADALCAAIDRYAEASLAGATEFGA